MANSAPWGQACTECVKAKCRCMLRDSGSACERCHRLSKTCTPSVTTRKRQLRTSSKRASLEDKLDDLVTLLRSQHGASPYPGGFVDTATSSEIPSLPTPLSAISASATDPCGKLTTKNLLDFRTHLHYFPFMSLPENTTAASFSRSHPVTAHAIHTLCTKALRLQVLLAQELRSMIAARVIVEGERSVDLLWAIVVCMIWSKYVTHGKQFLGSMCSLARTLVSDLRLDRPVNPAWCPSAGEPGATPPEVRTMEGSRVLIAVFILSAALSVTFKGEIMPWSIHIGEACDLLLGGGKQNDCDLIAMAKLARVIVNAADVARTAAGDYGAGQHAMLAIASLKLSLEQTKATLTPGQLQHSSIIAYLHTAEISILELALLPPSTSSADPSRQFFQSVELPRISTLHALLQSCTSVVTDFLKMDMIFMTTTSMLIYAYSLRLLYRLSTPKDAVPGWDPQVVRDTVNIGACVERAAQKAESTNAELQENIGEDSMFIVAANIMRATAGNWRLPGEDEDDVVVDAQWSANAPDGTDLPMIDFSNDFWLSTLNF